MPAGPVQPIAGPAHPGNHGGFKSFHDGSLLTLDCVHDTTLAIPGLPNQVVNGVNYPQGPGWHEVVVEGVNLRRFLGFLRPWSTATVPSGALEPPLPMWSGQPYVDDAAFELFAPLSPYAGEDVVFFLLCPGTVPPPRSVGVPTRDDRFVYPGHFSRDGLYRDESSTLPGPAQSDPSTARRGRVIARFFGVGAAGGPAGPHAPCAAAGIYPIFGRIIYSFPNKQTTFEVQRLLEFQRAVDLMLNDPSSAFRPPGMTAAPANFATVSAGGSNGGANASYLPLFWPDRFQAAGAMVYPPSLRRELGEHAFWEMTMGVSGFGTSGTAYLLGDALQWHMFPAMKTVADGLGASQRYSQWDLSYLKRFNDGTMPRPIYFVPGDEDSTTTGTDWAADISGVWMRHAAVPSGGNGPTFAYSISDNRCHESGPWDHPLGAMTGQQVVGLEQLLPELAIEAINQLNVPSAPIADVAEGAPAIRGVTPDDVYDRLMAHSPALAGFPQNSRASEPAGSGYLERSHQSPAAWEDELRRPGKLGGAGTWLGREDSMIVRSGFVYVGSADGVVSKYFVGTGHPRQPLVLDAQSPVLGRWVSGLTEGVFGGQSWIVCATYGHLFLLDPGTLSVQRSAPVAFDAFWPRRIVLADVDASVPGNEIVCPTFNGGILVFRDGGSAVPVERLHWPEPGVTDMVEYGGDLVLLSHRGVVARVRLQQDLTGAVRPFPSGTYVQPSDALVNGGYTGIAQLEAATQPQSGFPLDMELLQLANSSTSAVVTLYRANRDDEYSLRRFDVGTGALSVANWNVDGSSTALLVADGSGNGFDLETVRYTNPNQDEGTDTDGSPGDHIIVLNRGSLFVFDEGLQLLGARDLGEFAPARLAVDIAVGDIVPGPAVNGYSDEVVISTAGGRMVWVRVADLLGGSASSPLPLSSLEPMYSSSQRRIDWTSVTPVDVDFRSNTSTAAWWGLVVDGSDVHGFDQQASQWEVATDGTGLRVVNEVPVSPIKGVALVPQTTASGQGGTSGSSLGTDGDWIDLTGISWGASDWALFSNVEYPNDPPNRFMEPPPHFTWAMNTPMVQAVTDRFAVFRQPGDAWFDGATFAAHWWSGGDDLVVNPTGRVRFANVIEGMVGEVTPTAKIKEVQRVWASTRPRHANPTAELDIRSMDYGLSASDLQDLKILNGDPNRILVGTPGGDILVIDPDITLPPVSPGAEIKAPSVVSASSDLGHGVPAVTYGLSATAGMIDVFAVVALDHQPAANFSGAVPASIAGALHHYHLPISSGGSLVPVAKRRLGPSVMTPPSPPPVAPVPGMVPVGVLYADILSASPGPEVLVTGIFGEVVIYGVVNGALTAQPLQILRLEGNLGLHGSIQLVQGSVVISGSQGLWRLDPK